MRLERVCKGWRRCCLASSFNPAWKRMYLCQGWSLSISHAFWSQGTLWREKVRNHLSLDENWANGKYSQKLVTHSPSPIRAINFADNVLVTGTENGLVKTWDINQGVALKDLQGHTAGIAAIIMHTGHGIVVSGSSDRKIKIWDMAEGVCKLTLGGHTGPAWALASDNEADHIVSGSADTNIKQWDVNTGVCVQTLVGHQKEVGTVSLNHTQLLLSGSDDRTVKLWDLKSGQCISTLPQEGEVYTVYLDPSGRRLFAGGSDAILSVWDLTASPSLNGTVKEVSGKLFWKFTGHERLIRSCSVSERRIVTGSYDATIRVWNASTKRCIHILRGHNDKIEAVQCDQWRIVSGDTNGEVRIWNFKEHSHSRRTSRVENILV